MRQYYVRCSHVYLHSTLTTTNQYHNLYPNWKKRNKTCIPILFPDHDDTWLKQASISSQFHQSISYPREEKGT